jgi:ribosomal protein L1
VDSREFIEEVDLVKRLKATEFNSLIAEEKWNDQLRGLQLVIDILGPTPKIKSGTDVHDIVAVCNGFLRQVGSLILCTQL